MSAPRYDSRSMAIPAAQPYSEVEKQLNEGELEEVQFDIPEDAYGAGILAIVRDISVIKSGPSWDDEEVQLKCVQASFSFLLLSMNLTMQLSLLYFIWSFVVRPAVHQVQRRYLEFHERIFDVDGTFLPDQWDAYPGQEKEDLCQIGMSSPFFYFTVVFLWVLLIIREIRTTERLARDLLGMPQCDRMEQECETEGDAVKVVALTRSTKALIFSLVIIPKLVICSTLMWLGCQWLTATNSFSDLVMNSIAMEFVTSIDEALYETLLPIAHRRQVADINFVVWKPKGSAGSGRAKEFAAFKRSFIYLCVALSFVLVYKMAGQTVLPPHLHDLKVACQHLMEESTTDICTAPFWKGAIGLSNCFPYGGKAPDD